MHQPVCPPAHWSARSPAEWLTACTLVVETMATTTRTTTTTTVVVAVVIA